MKTIHILLVEDNEGDILLTTEAVADTKMAITLSIVKDGKEAIDFMARQEEYPGTAPVNLVLLDVNLPKKNGHEVLKFIKTKSALKDIPVVMLSTSSFKTDRDLAEKNAASGYLIKPLEAKDLVAVVDDLQIS